MFATGTPISNSMVELYTIQRYLQYNTLVQNNLQHFDAWASTFGETITAVELTPEGTGYRAKTRFARFYNLPELMAMFKEIADIKTADMLDLPVPKAVFHNISVKPSEIQKQMVAELAERAERVRNGMVDTFSAKSISDYLKAEHRALDNETVYSYLEKLEKAYLLHRCSRFDLQGKEILKTQEKFYLADTALRYSVLGYNSDSVASSLENVVYLELCRRGYTVNVGKSGSGEIDFVAVRQNEKLYVQVTQELRSPKTEKREYERLLEIHDNYPKYVLTTDEFSGGNYEGIKTMHIADFLLSSEY